MCLVFGMLCLNFPLSDSPPCHPASTRDIKEWPHQCDLKLIQHGTRESSLFMYYIYIPMCVWYMYDTWNLDDKTASQSWWWWWWWWWWWGWWWWHLLMVDHANGHRNSKSWCDWCLSSQVLGWPFCTNPFRTPSSKPLHPTRRYNPTRQSIDSVLRCKDVYIIYKYMNLFYISYSYCLVYIYCIFQDVTCHLDPFGNWWTLLIAPYEFQKQRFYQQVQWKKGHRNHQVATSFLNSNIFVVRSLLPLVFEWHPALPG